MGIEDEENEKLSESSRPSLVFRSGWLYRFEARNNFRQHKSHGEAGDADKSLIENELPILQTMLTSFHPKDISNADEFSIFVT